MFPMTKLYFFCDGQQAIKAPSLCKTQSASEGVYQTMCLADPETPSAKPKKTVLRHTKHLSRDAESNTMAH